MNTVPEFHFYIDTRLNPSSIHLVSAFLRLLKYHNFEYLDNNKVFFIDPTAFRYLEVNASARTYWFTEFLPEDTNPYNLEVHWNDAANNIIEERK